MKAIAMLFCLLSAGLSGCGKKETESEKLERIKKEERVRQETRDMLQFKKLCQRHVTFLNICSKSKLKTAIFDHWVRSCAMEPDKRNKAAGCLKHIGNCQKYNYCWIGVSDAEMRDDLGVP